MKKLLTLVLALALAFSLLLTACGDKEPSKPVSAGKVAIITGTVSQGEEEFRAAEGMKAKYGDQVITATYPDNFTKEVETVISNVVSLVSDTEVKALVFVQAIPGASAAIAKAREINPDLLVIAGVPGEDPGVVAPAADIVLATNEIGMGYTLPEQAKALGAKTFVHYSFPRHMSYTTLAARRDILKSECERLGLEFVDATAPDPLGDQGLPGAQQYMIEDVPKMVAKYGKDTAFFSTNCGMQEPLIKAVVDAGAIYPQPCCPSPYHGLPAALGVEFPEDKKGDIQYALDAIKAKLEEKGMAGRVSTWAVPANMVMIEGGTEYAFKYINGETDGKIDMTVMKDCLTAAAKGQEVKLDVLTDAGTTYDNYLTILCDFYTF